MKHRIVHEKPWFGRSGVNVVVHLEVNDIEQRLIRDNNMERVIIVEQEPTTKVITDREGKTTKELVDENIYFSKLYQRRTSWYAPSQIAAKDLHAKLFEGLQRFQVFLDENMTPATHSEGDLRPKPPQPFSIGLIPDYMWERHAYLLAESGGGKTQLLQTIVAQNLKKAKRPGMVIIDSQNQMLQLIKERVPEAIMIDPFDNPPSLDLFNPGTFEGGSTSTTMDTFLYLFNAGEEPMTGRQTTAFTYAIALMLLGYPPAYGEHATIEDLEEYLSGSKKGKELSDRAHRAVNAMPETLQAWYLNQYGRFDDSNSQILQRLSNICGPLAPLRPLFSKRVDTLNLKDQLENGAIVLVNTNRHTLGPVASSFFGRFFFKLLDKETGDRHELSRPMLFIADEVQEYFDSKVILNFLDQARKRNIACLFAHQRLAQLNNNEPLRDALTGVGTLINTNANKNDIRQVSTLFGVEQEQVHAWRPEYAEGNRRPSYADFGLIFKGKSAQTFRLNFLELEKMPVKKPAEKQSQSRTEGKAKAEQKEQHEERHKDPPNDNEYDDRYDQLDVIALNPAKAKNGTVLTVKCPNGHSHLENIPAGTKNGHRFVVRGVTRIRRPDNKNGNYWVELSIQSFADDKEEF